ncbi:hypothetical protein QBC39DRAFT_149493 [Podospora conica]|nr:hypothetical protein QBC39DRAFT_149493 [Schizothecium conicum]
MALWNPDQLLSIAGKARPGEIQCSAINTGDGRRCGWQKWTADPDNRAVQDMLPSLAAIPPADITTTQLLRLAELCLCRDKAAHFNQKGQLAGRWLTIIRKHVAATQQHIRPRTPETSYFTAQAAYPSPASSPESVVSSKESSHRTSSEIPDEEDSAGVVPGRRPHFAVPSVDEELRESREEIKKSQEELRRTQEELRKSQQELLKAQAELNNSQEQLLVALAEKRVLEKNRATMADAVKQLTIDHEVVQGEMSELKSAAEAREKEVRETRERAWAAESDANRVRLERDEARTRLADADGEKQRLAVEMGQLRERVASLEREKGGLNVELATEKTNVSNLCERLAIYEQRDAGRELVPMRGMTGDNGWKTRVQLWLGRLGGKHGKRPRMSRYDV